MALLKRAAILVAFAASLTYAQDCPDAWRLLLPRPGKVSVWFDAKLDSRYQVAFAEALKYWEQTIDAQFVIADKSTCGIGVTVEDKDTEEDILADSFLPNTTDFNGLVYVNTGGYIEKSTDLQLVYVFIHELGHIFGLKHSSDNESVMYKDTTGGILLLQSDLDKLKVFHPLIRETK